MTGREIRDDEAIPLQERIENVADEADLRDAYDTERHGLDVAGTRPEDESLVMGVARPDSHGGASLADDRADPTLIEWMLGLTPEQRLDALQGFVNSVWELRHGTKA